MRKEELSPNPFPLTPPLSREGRGSFRMKTSVVSLICLYNDLRPVIPAKAGILA